MSDAEVIDLLKRLRTADEKTRIADSEPNSHAANLSRLEAKAAAQRVAIERIEAQLKEQKVKERQVELEFRSVGEELIKLEAMGNSSGSSNIFAKTQKAIATKIARRQELENAGMSILEEIDRLAEQERVQRAQLDATLADVRAAREEGAAKRESWNAALAQIESERATVLAALPEGTRERYHDALAVASRPAFARVESGSCSECGSDLSSSVTSHPPTSVPVNCPACFRFLMNE